MTNGNVWYPITGLIRSVYAIWEMDNSHITNEELKIKSLFIQHFYMKYVWRMKNQIISYKGIPGWTWSMKDVWKMWNCSIANHVHKLIEEIWKINA